MSTNVLSRLLAARRERRQLQRISRDVSQHMLRDIGLERDYMGRVHRVPADLT